MVQSVPQLPRASRHVAPLARLSAVFEYSIIQYRYLYLNDSARPVPVALCDIVCILVSCKRHSTTGGPGGAPGECLCPWRRRRPHAQVLLPRGKSCSARAGPVRGLSGDPGGPAAPRPRAPEGPHARAAPQHRPMSRDATPLMPPRNGPSKGRTDGGRTLHPVPPSPNSDAGNVSNLPTSNLPTSNILGCPRCVVRACAK